MLQFQTTCLPAAPSAATVVRSAKTREPETRSTSELLILHPLYKQVAGQHAPQVHQSGVSSFDGQIRARQTDQFNFAQADQAGRTGQMLMGDAPGVGGRCQ